MHDLKFELRILHLINLKSELQSLNYLKKTQLISNFTSHTMKNRIKLQSPFIIN